RDSEKMSSSDAIVAQAAFDVLRLGRSAQFIVALLLRFWDSKNIKKHVKYLFWFPQLRDPWISLLLPPPTTVHVYEVVPSLKFHALNSQMLLGKFILSKVQTLRTLKTVVVYLSLWDEAAAILRIVEVLKHNNWYYVSCTGCSRKLDKSDQSPHCNRCVNLNATVDDANDNATFVVFDREMLQLTNLPAAALTLNEINSGGSEQLPQCLAKFAGKYFPNILPTPRQLHLLKGKLAKQITSTEVEGLKDDTHPEGVKEEEVGNTHTRE
ncbi:hypothetical protein HID58_025865, partial [Brassica napus]